MNISSPSCLRLTMVEGAHRSYNHRISVTLQLQEYSVQYEEHYNVCRIQDSLWLPSTILRRAGGTVVDLEKHG